jgi:hypothetical protein
MRNVGLVLLAISAALAVFGYWGASTVAGRRQFDEMAGMIPVASTWLGGLLALAAAVLLLIAYLRR